MSELSELFQLKLDIDIYNTSKEIKPIENLINDYPRNTLGYKTAPQVMMLHK